MYVYIHERVYVNTLIHCAAEIAPSPQKTTTH